MRFQKFVLFFVLFFKIFSKNYSKIESKKVKKQKKKVEKKRKTEKACFIKHHSNIFDVLNSKLKNNQKIK